MATQLSVVTVDEYLSEEERSAVRHEYWNGHVVAMAGGTPTHADIVSNLNAIIKAQTRGSGCYVRTIDLRVRTAHDGLYTYPDLVISCNSKFDGTTLLNPCALIEVLSSSTEDYDRGSKFERYRKISSFREYVVVAQTCIHVEHHIRDSANSERWVMRQFESPKDEFSINLSGDRAVRIGVAAIYDDLELGFAGDEA